MMQKQTVPRGLLFIYLFFRVLKLPTEHLILRMLCVRTHSFTKSTLTDIIFAYIYCNTYLPIHLRTFKNTHIYEYICNSINWKLRLADSRSSLDIAPIYLPLTRNNGRALTSGFPLTMALIAQGFVVRSITEEQRP